jgi:hypothetical protein
LPIDTHAWWGLYSQTTAGSLPWLRTVESFHHWKWLSAGKNPCHSASRFIFQNLPHVQTSFSLLESG